MDAETAPTERPIGPEALGPLTLHPHLAGTGRWQRFTYSGPAGSRRYFVYTPAGYTLDQRVPMVVMLHGCTQTPADSAAGTAWNPLADRQTFIVVYPEQTLGDNLLSCWNWFLPEHQARGSGEAGILAGITQQVLTSDTRWNIDPGRVYVCGISAGAAMAVILGATHPDLYAAVGIHAGLEYRAATDPSTARSAMATGGPDPIQQGTAAFAAMAGRARPVPSIVLHGTADGVVQPVNGDQVVRQWMQTNRLATDDAYRPDFARPTTLDSGQVPHGHAYTVARWSDEQGTVVQEYWRVTGMNHAWSGGSVFGSFTDPQGPGATDAMWEFFAHHRNQLSDETVAAHGARVADASSIPH
jgi:poly(hydroxyalkanoate) depolymerase family esterase